MEDILTEKSLILDPNMVQLGMWLFGFLVTALVGIIVWLAKAVINKLEIISEKQDKNRSQISLVEQMLSGVKEDMSSIKTDNQTNGVRLAKLETQVALHRQWIHLKGGTVNTIGDTE